MRPLSDFIITDNPNLKALSLAEVWKLTSEREAYKADYARHWNSVGTDIPARAAEKQSVSHQQAKAIIS